MYKILSITALIFISFTLIAQIATPDFGLVGFATQNGGTTGGAGGTETTVSTYEGLKAAVAGAVKKTVYVVGKIEVSGGGESIEVGSNTSIIGVGITATISQVQLYLKNASNVIIRNITFTAIGSTKGSDSDCISIATTSSGKCSNIWIDHCEFYNETPIRNASASVKDRYDGLIDIKKTSEYITISWCYFHDHYKAILVGFTNTDTYDRKITLHHNKFERIGSRVPSFRGGTAHIYNNYYLGSTDAAGVFGDGINTREGACLFVENNYFMNMGKGVYCAYADVAFEGFAYGTGNEFVNCNMGWDPVLKTCNSFTPGYSYLKNEVAEIPAIVDLWAGVGKLDDETTDNAAPTVVLTAPTEGSTLDAAGGITLSANASDSDGTVLKVDFYANSKLVGSSTTTPFHFIWNSATASHYILTAVATDNLGASTTSLAVNITVTGTGIEEPDEDEDRSSIETTGFYHLEEYFNTGNEQGSYGNFTTNLNTAGTTCKYFPSTSNAGYTGYVLLDKKRSNTQSFVTFEQIPNCGEIEILCRASSARNITLEKRTSTSWEKVDSIEISSTQIWAPDKAKTLNPVQFRLTTTNTGGDVYLYQVLISEGKAVEQDSIDTAIKPLHTIDFVLFQRDNQLIIKGEITQIRILGLTGIVLSENINQNEIFIGSLSQGIYLAQITDNYGKTQVRKFIKF